MGAQAHHRISVDVAGGGSWVISSHYCSADTAGRGSVIKRVKEEADARGVSLGKVDYAKYVDGLGWDVRVFQAGSDDAQE
jgi:hypothetical protein